MIEDNLRASLAESFSRTGHQVFESVAGADSELWTAVEGELQRGLGWSGEEAQEFVDAGHEAFINAVQHGNKDNATGEGGRRVTVTWNLGREETEVTVEDEGKGFNISEAPDPLAGENLLKGSGRGLFLMRKYCSEVKVSEGEGGKGCKVTLIKRRKSA